MASVWRALPVVLIAGALVIYSAAMIIPGRDGCDYPGRDREGGPTTTSIERPPWPPGPKCHVLDPQTNTRSIVYERWDWAPWVILALLGLAAAAIVRRLWLRRTTGL
jgi:hypothetical protein